VTIYRFIKLAADGKVDHAGAAQGRVDGIAAETVAADGDVLPMVLPMGSIAKVEVGSGGVTAGGLVATDASGKAIAVGASNGDQAWGVALDAGAEGDIVRILFGYKGQINA
jgi:alanine dehydrogenase